MRDTRIRTFYKPEMALKKRVEENFSQSPNKPRLFIDYVNKKGKSDLLLIDEDFDPYSKEDFYIAHTKSYVDRFFDTGDETNKLKWSQEFAETVKYTNSSFYNAIKYSILNPEVITFSPTAGFHHATPYNGLGFCTFSGQVIASKKIYDQFGISGAYIDLDAHYGNSIIDSIKFVKDLDKAILFNINPMGRYYFYKKDLLESLQVLKDNILNGNVKYLVFAHGADSTEKDDSYGGRLSDDEWIEMSYIVYEFIKKIDTELGRPIPLTLSLFGGYRKNFDEVLELHLKDLQICHAILCKK